MPVAASTPEQISGKPRAQAEPAKLPEQIPKSAPVKSAKSPEQVSGSTLAESSKLPEPSTPEREPEIKVSRLAQGIEAKAIEAKLTQGFEGLPEYETVKVADQASRAADFLKSEPDKAVQVALGNLTPPVNVLPESVFIAVENQALKIGDVDRVCVDEPRVSDIARASDLREGILKAGFCGRKTPDARNLSFHLLHLPIRFGKSRAADGCD